MRCEFFFSGRRGHCRSVFPRQIGFDGESSAALGINRARLRRQRNRALFCYGSMRREKDHILRSSSSFFCRNSSSLIAPD